MYITLYPGCTHIVGKCYRWPEMLLAWHAAILVTSDLVNGVLGASLCYSAYVSKTLIVYRFLLPAYILIEKLKVFVEKFDPQTFFDNKLLPCF